MISAGHSVVPLLKDRTFFFFSYEGLRLRLPQTTLTTVPDVTSQAECSSQRSSLT